MKHDKHCIFCGDFAANNKLAISEPIHIDKFKSIAHKNKVCFYVNISIT